MIVSRDINKLCPCIRSKYIKLIEFSRESHISLTLLETIRTPELQQHYVNIGASKTLKSKHLPQEPYQLALAFDIAPTNYLPLRHWNPYGEAWKTLGLYGESIGLTWGGRWKTFVDNPHFQLDRCQCGNPTRT